MTDPERLVELSELNPEHLATFIQLNNRVFYDPAAVGDLRQPTGAQFAHFVRQRFRGGDLAEDIELYSAIDHALRTGEVDGLARGDSCADSDDNDEGEVLEEVWRDTTCDGWAAALKAYARVPDTLPLAVRLPLRGIASAELLAWLEQHLPRVLTLLKQQAEAAPAEGFDAEATTAAQAARVAETVNDLIDALLPGAISEIIDASAASGKDGDSGAPRQLMELSTNQPLGSPAEEKAGEKALPCAPCAPP